MWVSEPRAQSQKVALPLFNLAARSNFERNAIASPFIITRTYGYWVYLQVHSVVVGVDAF